MENELTLSFLLLIRYTSQRQLQMSLLRILSSRMKGARHLALWMIALLCQQMITCPLWEAQVLSVYMTCSYTQEILMVRISLKNWSTTLGPVVSICFLRWVAHMCRETGRGSRTARDSTMWKGRNQLFPCLGHSAQHWFPARKFVPAITWFLFSFGLSFFEDFCLLLWNLALPFGLMLNANIIWLCRHCIVWSLCPIG